MQITNNALECMNYLNALHINIVRSLPKDYEYIDVSRYNIRVHRKERKGCFLLTHISTKPIKLARKAMLGIKKQHSVLSSSLVLAGNQQLDDEAKKFLLSHNIR